MSDDIYNEINKENFEEYFADVLNKKLVYKKSSRIVTGIVCLMLMTLLGVSFYFAITNPNEPLYLLDLKYIFLALVLISLFLLGPSRVRHQA